MGRSKFVGARETAAAMKKIVPGLRSGMIATSRAALRPMLRAAKAGAPRDKGLLRKALAIKQASKRKLRPSFIVGPRNDVVGPDGERPIRYAHLTEFGRAAGKNGKGGMPGTRWLTAAFKATAGAVLDTMERELPKEIEKAAAKVARQAAARAAKKG
jgi:hypothetical protein